MRYMSLGARVEATKKPLVQILDKGYNGCCVFPDAVATMAVPRTFRLPALIRDSA